MHAWLRRIHLWAVVPLVWLVLLGALAPRPTLAQEPHAAPFTLILPQIYASAGLVDPSPTIAAAEQSLNTVLAWRMLGPGGANARYTVLLEAWDSTPDVVAATSLAATHLDPGTLELDTVYYWQVVAVRANGVAAAGPVWHFRTEPWSDAPSAGSMVPIPAGDFLMGCDAANTGESFVCVAKDTPLHRVWLDAYAIDKYEVTNGQYLACVAAGDCQWPRNANSHERGDYLTNGAYSLYPVIYVSREDSIRYCAWAGKRLPTEAEWEKAGRGPYDTRPFPWGDEYPDCTRMNRPTAQSCPDEPQDTARVGRYPRGASPYGVHDLSGNVFEWVLDHYDEGYYRVSPDRNPLNDSTRTDFYVIRGGSYRDRIAYMRVSHRHFGHHGDTVGGDSPFYRNDRVGFRCAMSLP